MYKLVSTDADVNMTAFQGCVEAYYSDLVKVFGHPTYDTPSADDKVSTEWCLKFFDPIWKKEVVATIYDWKEYDGGLRCRGSDAYGWHIGGKSQDAIRAVMSYFEQVMSEEAA